MATNPLVSNVIGKTRGLGSTVTDFVRNNPVVSGAVVTLGGAAIVTGIVTKVRKKPKRKKAKRKTTTRRRKTKKTKVEETLNAFRELYKKRNNSN